jgi:hypothetical protein
MKLRTTDDLGKHLDGVFSWRFKEIVYLKSAVRKLEEPRRSTLIRSGVPLLYAHWEGFIKQAAEALVNFVANQGCTFEELDACYVIRAMRTEYGALSDDTRFARQLVAVQVMRERRSERATIRSKGAIRTKANLSAKQFEDIANSIGIDPAPYALRRQFIDSSLLDRRNRIAHGEYLDVDHVGFEELCDDVLSLVRRFKDDVENYAVRELFKKTY